MNIELMKTILTMSTPRLFNYVHLFLRSKYPAEDIIIIDNKQWMFARGNGEPVLLCAHLDTVFANPPINIFVDKEQEVMWAPAGLGSDDRAGVYAIMDILMSGCCPSVLFTTGEEEGCSGTFDLLKYFPNNPFEDIKMIIQLDRKEQREAVYYSCENKNFENWISSFGFYTDQGTFTDIAFICPNWGIAGVNLSVGYFNEHTKQEYLRYNYLLDTIERVKRILYSSTSKHVPKFDYIPNENAKFYKKNFLAPVCDNCGRQLKGPDLYCIEGSEYDYFFCEECYNKIGIKEPT